MQQWRQKRKYVERSYALEHILVIKCWIHLRWNSLDAKKVFYFNKMIWVNFNESCGVEAHSSVGRDDEDFIYQFLWFGGML